MTLDFSSYGKVTPSSIQSAADRSAQSQYPDVFMKAAVYDGKKNLYTSYKLDFGGEVSRQVRFLICRIVLFISMNAVRCDLDRRQSNIEL